jgi:hypothetical protein
MLNGFVPFSPYYPHTSEIAKSDTIYAYAQRWVCPGSGVITISEIGCWAYTIPYSIHSFKLAIFTDDPINGCPEALVENSETPIQNIIVL